VSGDLQFGAVRRRRPADRERESPPEEAVVAVRHPAEAGPAFAVPPFLGAFDPQGEFDEGSAQFDRPRRRGARLMPSRPEQDGGEGEGGEGERSASDGPNAEHEGARSAEQHRAGFRSPGLIERAS